MTFLSLYGVRSEKATLEWSFISPDSPMGTSEVKIPLTTASWLVMGQDSSLRHQGQHGDCASSSRTPQERPWWTVFLGGSGVPEQGVPTA